MRAVGEITKSFDVISFWFSRQEENVMDREGQSEPSRAQSEIFVQGVVAASRIEALSERLLALCDGGLDAATDFDYVESVYSAGTWLCGRVKDCVVAVWWPGRPVTVEGTVAQWLTKVVMCRPKT